MKNQTIAATLCFVSSSLVLTALARRVAQRKTAEMDERWTARVGVKERGAAAISLTIGMARIRAAAHWPSDVFAGMALGAASANAVSIALWLT